MNPIRVLLVDKCPEFLDAAARFLAGDPELLVVGQLESTGNAVKQVALLQPHVVLMELEMPQINGLVTALHLKAQSNPPRIVIVTARSEPPYRALAEAAGADGFVAKHHFCTEVVLLIKRLAALAEGPAAQT